MKNEVMLQAFNIETETPEMTVLIVHVSSSGTEVTPFIPI